MCYCNWMRLIKCESAALLHIVDRIQSEKLLKQIQMFLCCLQLGHHAKVKTGDVLTNEHTCARGGDTLGHV